MHTPRTQEEWERDVIGFKQEEVLAFADRLFAETKAFEMKEQMAPHPVGVVRILCMHHSPSKIRSTPKGCGSGYEARPQSKT